MCNKITRDNKLKKTKKNCVYAKQILLHYFFFSTKHSNLFQPLTKYGI